MSLRKRLHSRRFLGMGNESFSLENRVERLERGLYVDPGVDWVGQVLHERWLADRDTRTLREHGPAPRRARVNL
jgi:hypothetical protein